MNVPKVDIKQLLEAGVHLGHKTLRWIQRWKSTSSVKKLIHIIDLTQTVEFIKSALTEVHKVISSEENYLLYQQKNKPQSKLANYQKKLTNTMLITDG